jgi:hypothetical protein
MSKIVQDVIDKLSPLFQATEEVLNDWKGDGNLQFPVLLGMMAVKLNWDEKQVRENDPLVRYYVRNNPDWYVTRGAHGGIMRSTEKQKKEVAKLAKEAAKAQVLAAVEAKVAAATATAVNNTSTDSSDISDSEDSE